MSVNTLILIVLGVLILVFLIIGFSIGWNKIFPFINPPNNVKDVVDRCNYYCDIQSKYDFCSSVRDVKVEGALEIPANSDKYQYGDLTFGDRQGKFKGTCSELTMLGTQLDVRTCGAIICDSDPVYSDVNFAKLACAKGRVADGTQVRYLVGSVTEPVSRTCTEIASASAG